MKPCLNIHYFQLKKIPSSVKKMFEFDLHFLNKYASMFFSVYICMIATKP